MMAPKFALTAFAAGVLLASSAQAVTTAPLTGLQTLQQFNLITLQNATTSNHVDGRSWIGGTFTGNNAVFAMHPQDIVASNYAAMTVMGQNAAANTTVVSGVQVQDKGFLAYGNVSNTSINNGAAAVIGNTSNTSFNGSGSHYVSGTTSGGNMGGTNVTNLTGTTQATYMAAANSTDFSAVLGGLSTSLKNLTSTSSVNIVGGKATFNAVAVNGVAVFDLTSYGSTLFSKEFEFNLNGATSVIFNSGLTSISLNDSFLGSSAPNLGDKFIWNFYNATSLSVDKQFGGTILATNAALTVNQNVEGGIFVKTLASQTAEIHLKAYSGILPVTAVPEPETYAMLLAGLGIMGFLARRRKQA